MKDAINTDCTYTRIQKNSPTIFGNQLAKELEIRKKQNQEKGKLLNLKRH